MHLAAARPGLDRGQSRERRFQCDVAGQDRRQRRQRVACVVRAGQLQ